MPVAFCCIQGSVLWEESQPSFCSKPAIFGNYSDNSVSNSSHIMTCILVGFCDSVHGSTDSFLMGKAVATHLCMPRTLHNAWSMKGFQQIFAILNQWISSNSDWKLNHKNKIYSFVLMWAKWFRKANWVVQEQLQYSLEQKIFLPKRKDWEIYPYIWGQRCILSHGNKKESKRAGSQVRQVKMYQAFKKARREFVLRELDSLYVVYIFLLLNFIYFRVIGNFLNANIAQLCWKLLSFFVFCFFFPLVDHGFKEWIWHDNGSEGTLAERYKSWS